MEYALDVYFVQYTLTLTLLSGVSTLVGIAYFLKLGGDGNFSDSFLVIIILSLFCCFSMSVQVFIGGMSEASDRSLIRLGEIESRVPPEIKGLFYKEFKLFLSDEFLSQVEVGLLLDFEQRHYDEYLKLNNESLSKEADEVVHRLSRVVEEKLRD